MTTKHCSESPLAVFINIQLRDTAKRGEGERECIAYNCIFLPGKFSRIEISGPYIVPVVTRERVSSDARGSPSCLSELFND